MATEQKKPSTVKCTVLVPFTLSGEKKNRERGDIIALSPVDARSLMQRHLVLIGEQKLPDVEAAKKAAKK